MILLIKSAYAFIPKKNKYVFTSCFRTHYNLCIICMNNCIISHNAYPLHHHHLFKNINIKTDIILPLILYGCETWSLTLKAEHGLRVFEKWVSRRLFGPRRQEVTRGWRKLHFEELHSFTLHQILLG
jgi:hypothetical protein